jgi:2,4-dienoyl-CoA reductase (NADPH2)
VTRRLKREVAIPLITTNRINMPDVAERILAAGDADMVSMARPLLADPEFVRKAAEDRADEINTCIGCNQACLDHTFNAKVASCLVNPRACHETELNYAPAKVAKKFAVVGAGPAGLAAATTLAERGHSVDLFEASDEIGGQLNMAKAIPGKEEFHEMLRYFRRRLELTGVRLHLKARVDAEQLLAHSVDAVIVATGVVPRDPQIEGQRHPKVLSYVDVLHGKAPVGRRVAIVGAGGIGFDVAEFLVQDTPSPTVNRDEWLREWGVGDPATARGGVAGIEPHVSPPLRDVVLLQRKGGKLGAGLGKTTGWIHRATLKMKRVKMQGGVNYERIDDRGLLVTTGEARANPTWLEVDNIVLCAVQESQRELVATL